MKKKILFIWNYFYFPWEKGKSRFSDLANAFVEPGYDLEVVCSSFYHMGKSKRNVSDPRIAALPYRVTLLREPGYSKNVSLDRVRSLRAFDRALIAVLKNHEDVDFVYLPFPPIGAARIVLKWCKTRRAKVVLDVEDLWPESFRMLIRPRRLCSLLTLPLSWQANAIYRRADAIVAVSSMYQARALRVRHDVPPSAVAPIGSDIEYVQEVLGRCRADKSGGEFWLAYIGTLGSSYDLSTVIDASSLLKRRGFDQLRVKIMGSGPDEERLRKQAEETGAPVEFLGLLPYEEMVAILGSSDVAINPIVSRSVASLINKIGDYAATGLPIINTQNCPEFIEMLEEYRAGTTLLSPTPEMLADEIQKYAEGTIVINRNDVLKMAKNRLSRRKSQADILALLSSL